MDPILYYFEVEMIRSGKIKRTGYCTKQQAKRAYHNAKSRYPGAEIALHDLVTGETINQHLGI
jgi:hypothetical protein